MAVLQGMVARVELEAKKLGWRRGDQSQMGVRECISGCTCCSRLESGSHIPKCTHAHLVISPNSCLLLFLYIFLFCSSF